MEIGINKKEHKHKGQLGGRVDNSSNPKRINLALQGGALTALSPGEC
jgi:NTE family protein